MNMRTVMYLELRPNSIMLWLTKWPIIYNNFKKTSTLYWKCLASKTVLLYRILQRSWYNRFEISASFGFCIISRNSFHQKSSHDYIRKNVGTPNCFNIAIIADLNFFQYDAVTLIELINVKPGSFDTHCLTVSLKHQVFNTPAFNETPETFRIPRLFAPSNSSFAKYCASKICNPYLKQIFVDNSRFFD